ncbi:MAG: hypothetical protein NTX64_14365 [Elusimicrobia bacterium]|nr:hypothetical protein [Elusimicrobiota bacterium]
MLFAFPLSLLLCAPPASAGRGDALAVPAPAEAGVSAARLGEAYRKAKSADQRFWLVAALGGVLESGREEAALEPLLQACRDSAPDVRRRALGALEAWRALPEPSRERWRPRLREEAARAEKDRATLVRGAGHSLAGALSRPFTPPLPAGRPSTRSGASRGRLAAAAALWAVCLQVALLAWLGLSLSLLRESGEKGAAALAWLGRAASRADYLVFPCLSAAALFPVVGLGLTVAFVHALGLGARAPGWIGWTAFALALYAFCAVAVFLPAALLAFRAGRGAPPRGVLRAAWESLDDLPQALPLALLLAAACPVGAAWRAFARRAPTSPWQWLAAYGSPWAGYLAAAGGARAGVGWRGGLARVWRLRAPEEDCAWLARPLSQAPLWILFLAAPALFSLALSPAVLFSAAPAELADLWRMPDVGVVAVFGVLAGALAVATFLAFLSGAGALCAAGAANRDGA